MSIDAVQGITWTGPSGYGGAFGYQEVPSGLKLLGHRYYDSTTCAFISRDPAQSGRNWYAYCDNRPLVVTDPAGLNLTVIGDNRDLEHWDWAAEYAFGVGGRQMRQPTKAELVEALINENGPSVMLWGHGGVNERGGFFIINAKNERLYKEDIDYIQQQMLLRGKVKLRHIALRICDSCRSSKWLNAWLRVADQVTGFTTKTDEGPQQSWSSPVQSDPKPRFFFWVKNPNNDKKPEKMRRP